MSEEEKKAIERIDYIQDFIIENGQYNADVNDMEYFSKILNLIKKQQEQLQEKDKIIDLMAEMITEAKFCYFKKEKGGELLGEYRCYNKAEWIEYFTKKAREV